MERKKDKSRQPRGKTRLLVIEGQEWRWSRGGAGVHVWDPEGTRHLLTIQEDQQGPILPGMVAERIRTRMLGMPARLKAAPARHLDDGDDGIGIPV